MWVNYGHRTPYPKTSSCDGVVSHEIKQIALTTADLQGLNVELDDIQNAYLQFT